MMGRFVFTELVETFPRSPSTKTRTIPVRTTCNTVSCFNIAALVRKLKPAVFACKSLGCFAQLFSLALDYSIYLTLVYFGDFPVLN